MDVEDEDENIHNRVSERNIPALETRIVLFMSKISAAPGQPGVIMNQGLRQTITLGLAEISVIKYS